MQECRGDTTFNNNHSFLSLFSTSSRVGNLKCFLFESPLQNFEVNVYTLGVGRFFYNGYQAHKVSELINYRKKLAGEASLI